MSLKLAFVGFRHSHIFDLYRRAQAMPEIEVVAACEEDSATRAALAQGGEVAITHDDYARMLAGCTCDAIAVGDYYAVRGQRVLDALAANKHVVSDKPLCTSLDELDQIEASKRGLSVVCMLDMRDGPPAITARALIRQGTIGEVHAVSFGGQHALSRGKTRPEWYFEQGKHGGTINDIGVHALDAIPWITGLRFASVQAARCWNAFAPDLPYFEDAGQMMLTLENGAGVMGDVSYMMPDSSGTTLPFYWRMTFWGRKGVLEVAHNQDHVVLALDGEEGVRREPLLSGNPGGYLRAFLHDIAGSTGEGELCTADTLRAMRTSLLTQHAADSRTFDVRLSM